MQTIEIDYHLWLQSIEGNPAFDFLKEEAENIYTLKDGKSFEP